MMYIKEEIPFYFKNFLTYTAVVKNRSPKTVKEYFLDIRLFLRYIALFKNTTWNLENLKTIDYSKVTIDNIKNIDLQYIYDYMLFSKTHLNNSSFTRARKIASLKSFFNYLTLKVKLIEFNPTLELESPKLSKRLPKYLNLNESINLLDTISGEYKIRDYCIITLFLNCGMRLSELVGINLDNIKKDKLTIIGKGNSEREVYLNESCIRAIEEYLKVRHIDGIKFEDRSALFLSERKQRISKRTVQVIVKKNIVASGLSGRKYSTHKLRHTSATLMYQEGNVDLRTLQEILGHKSINSTEIYTHVSNQQKKDAMNSNPLNGVKRK